MLKKMVLIFSTLLLTYTVGFTAEIAGITVPEKMEIQGKELILNGSGIRKKFFIKVYVGSLYTESKIDSTKALFKDNFIGVVKMSILYDKIDAIKLQAAYADGFKDNTPNDIDDPILNHFISAFNFAAVEGDIIDIIFTNGDTVTIKHNNSEKASFTSKKLVNAVLKVYFGDNPADKNLKKGMLN